MIKLLPYTFIFNLIGIKIYNSGFSQISSSTQVIIIYIQNNTLWIANQVSPIFNNHFVEYIFFDSN